MGQADHMLEGNAEKTRACDTSLEDFARGEVARVLGSATRIRDVDVMHAAATSTVLLVTLTGPPQRVVFKVAEHGSSFGTDFDRTAAVVKLARDAGVPAAEVLAVDTTGRAGPWQYLLQEHVPGLPWRKVRPLLDQEETDAAHRKIAAALLASQAVRFEGFGELDRLAGSAGVTLLAGLSRRADRILRERDRAAFLQLLSHHDYLFVDNCSATLCHDDLHHNNVLFAQHADGWQLAGILDWDKAWAGPVDSDVARMAFWDDMTGPGFWQVYRAAVPVVAGDELRLPIYQLLWCLEYDDGSDRHAADTAGLWHHLGEQRPELPNLGRGAPPG